MVQGFYSPYLIFFATYEWARQARVFVPVKPFQPSVSLQSSLLEPIVSYRESEVLLISGLYYKTFRIVIYDRKLRSSLERKLRSYNRNPSYG
jgi:hypothetical protein